jgi:hypothetical protein
MKKSFIFFLLIIVASCGFRVIDPSTIAYFEVAEIEVSGDSRINFKIKNKIILNSKSSSKERIFLNLHTDKIKSIKEKNIYNETTKFKITVNVKIEVKNMDGKKKIFYKSKTGEFNVNNTRYSQTLNNEKKTIEVIAELLAEEIISEIALILNDI